MSARTRVKLTLAEGGAFLTEEVSLPTGGRDRYDRLVDWLREDPEVLKALHVDPDRLVAAQLLED